VRPLLRDRAPGRFAGLRDGQLIAIDWGPVPAGTETGAAGVSAPALMVYTKTLLVPAHTT
jgi:hypothetical protein